MRNKFKFIKKKTVKKNTKGRERTQGAIEKKHGRTNEQNKEIGKKWELNKKEIQQKCEIHKKEIH